MTWLKSAVAADVLTGRTPATAAGYDGDVLVRLQGTVGLGSLFNPSESLGSRAETFSPK